MSAEAGEPAEADGRARPAEADGGAGPAAGRAPFPLVASAALVGGAIVDSVIDGEDVVVWRTESGEPCVMEARCPHQWSHLGAQGCVDGDEIVCLTHGWRFRTDGTGWKVAMSGRRDRKGDITVWPCEERDGRIWVLGQGGLPAL